MTREEAMQRLVLGTVAGAIDIDAMELPDSERHLMGLPLCQWPDDVLIRIVQEKLP